MRAERTRPGFVGAGASRVAGAGGVGCAERAEAVCETCGLRAAALREGRVGVAGDVFGGFAVGEVAYACCEGVGEEGDK